MITLKPIHQILLGWFLLILGILILSTTCLFSQSIIESDNGDYGFYYLDANRVVTKLGDTIEVGPQLVDIDNEGHIYFSHYTTAHGYFPIYINDPFIIDVTSTYGFAQYKNGIQLQWMMINDETVYYFSNESKLVTGFIRDSSYLNIWNYE